MRHSTSSDKLTLAKSTWNSRLRFRVGSSEGLAILAGPGMSTLVQFGLELLSSLLWRFAPIEGPATTTHMTCTSAAIPSNVSNFTRMGTLSSKLKNSNRHSNTTFFSKWFLKAPYGKLGSHWTWPKNLGSIVCCSKVRSFTQTTWLRAPPHVHPMAHLSRGMQS